MSDFFSRHNITARIAVFWAMGIVTFLIVLYSNHIGKITGADATVIVSVVGIFTAAVTFLERSRS